MSISSKTEVKKEPQKTETQGTQNDNPRLKAIQRMSERSTKFNEDAKQIVTLVANVAETVVFPKDFYIDYEDLFNEAVQVHKKSVKDAAEYAEKNYRVWRRLETDSEDPTRTYAQTTYKVTLPNSTFPEMVRDLKLSSKNGLKAVNEELQKVAMVTDGPIIMKILKKQGASKFQVTWDVQGAPYNVTASPPAPWASVNIAGAAKTRPTISASIILTVALSLIGVYYKPPLNLSVATKKKPTSKGGGSKKKY